ncbi:tRNA A64-2'-O-ribosylphosphate transferase [Coemansia sp. RSA 1939]|nr:tRNA A64-2'-O-ribosylphosphate transferase [Coemansia sp. RSA 1939]KAJ2600346.1 tRNA A64-2'-O-ribosylphosphate transferase [Coemansia sp. RSA 1804]KAJ2693231.1 tRNA A64-2'-O-ribosylphosphate transferase [Coemansia sp. RSA 1285]
MSESKSRIDRQLRNETRNLYNRLRSIDNDAEFIQHVTQQLLPQYPVFANERCGTWYVDPAISRQQYVYFKSTDGHNGSWMFSLRRANTHLLMSDSVAESGGCIIVDSTRRGKSMPDSFSRTIPIWCAVWNRAIHRAIVGAGGSGASDSKDDARLAIWDTRVHMPPTVVSESERTQVGALLDGFADKLVASDIDVSTIAAKLLKPLRPIWITRDHRLVFPPDFSDASFTPVICLSASLCSAEGKEMGGGSLSGLPFRYVQGAADDQEAWALGLTPQLFWKHRTDLLLFGSGRNSSAMSLSSLDACEDAVRRIVAANSSPASLDEYGSGSNSDCFQFIAGTQLAVGNRASGRPPECWTHFDAVINCGAPEFEEHAAERKKSEKEEKGLAEPRYIYLPIPEGKRGQAELSRQIPRALAFVEPLLLKESSCPKRILVHCSQGVDRSVGVALAILTRFFDNNRRLLSLSSAEESNKIATSTAKLSISKEDIQNRLLWIVTSRPRANPSRVTLKRVNRFFLDII